MPLNFFEGQTGTTSQRLTMGDFLLRRLQEAGVRHLFGVSGDYNLEPGDSQECDLGDLDAALIQA